MEPAPPPGGDSPVSNESSFSPQQGYDERSLSPPPLLSQNPGELATSENICGSYFASRPRRFRADSGPNRSDVPGGD